MSAVPEELRYTQEHEWVAVQESGAVRIGITDYAQRQLGDVVFTQLPEPGQHFAAGDTIGEVESTKSVSEIYMPLAGEVLTRNTGLEDQPESLNEDPYGDGWMIEVRPDDPSELDGLLDAGEYAKLADNG
ncbi:glycine cleavage system protein GcvH [Actinoalloteichus spitiensis]|uniref:glycine cleavage system protein GcvH n=1 Tax=Actinoalloteichus spitiensis TaxID=252394 RepID=UPI0002FA5A62|nr:glycine cleavage system protein GcvH [Actinoalloteichus spitiensis]